LWAADRTFQPALAEPERAALYARWKKAVAYQTG
jgi:glycerol kinase